MFACFCCFVVFAFALLFLLLLFFFPPTVSSSPNPTPSFSFPLSPLNPLPFLLPMLAPSFFCSRTKHIPEASFFLRNAIGMIADHKDFVWVFFLVCCPKMIYRGFAPTLLCIVYRRQKNRKQTLVPNRWAAPVPPNIPTIIIGPKSVVQPRYPQTSQQKILGQGGPGTLVLNQNPF